MKRTIRTLGWRFNADRIVMDYTQKCYVPAAGYRASREKIEHKGPCATPRNVLRAGAYRA